MTPGRSPCGWPVARIRRAIAAEFPRFRRASIRVLRRGHALVVEADREWIFKFAWHPLANLKAEIAILRRLGIALPVPIPVPLLVGRGGRFFGYRKITGRTPTPGLVRRLAPAARAALAADLAGLVVAVQRAVPRRERTTWLGRPRPARRADVREVEAVAREFAAIFVREPDLVRRSRAVFRAYARRLRSLTPARLRYAGFDLQFDNLLLDPRGRLAGVLDWGYLTWSDAPGLFALLHKDDPALARRVMALAARRLKTRIPSAPAAVQGRGQVFSYLVELSTNRWDMAARRREWLKTARRLS